MINLVVLIVIAFAFAVIFVAGFLHFKKDAAYAMKFLAVTLICLEIYKFFYNVSTFDNGNTPAGLMPLSVITLLAVCALFGAFLGKENKLRTIMQNIVVLAALVPVTFAIINNSLWYSPMDTYYMVSAIYFVQCGLLLAYAFYGLRNAKCVWSLLIAIGFVAFVLGATLFTNWLWETEFLFGDTLSNILIPIVGVASVLVVWGLAQIKEVK